jgi:hypothetical protein
MADQAQNISIYEPAQQNGAIRQGEIITELTQFIVNIETEELEEPEIIRKKHPYALVVSQDCDLDWDYKARAGLTQSHKLLPNILLCEVVTAEELRGNTEINSRIWDSVRNNKNERYQFLQRASIGEDGFSEGLPELAVDFKRYFTIPTEEVYLRTRPGGGARRRCRLISPYVEHFSSRFCYFQSRIALPSEHFSEPNV